VQTMLLSRIPVQLGDVTMEASWPGVPHDTSPSGTQPFPQQTNPGLQVMGDVEGTTKNDKN
jgi:hypothetical protein